ncbi:MAG: ribokinase [Xanthomonadales bacterium]|nr:ribokinase [Gammaproteobacteria bacterium]NNE04701.1 ribokinase [Xanthomonadales bacterium]NNL96309.1 ribokinase [Xanthomonadales bacterium]
MTIAVVGSLNLDLVARVSHFPRPGETLTGARISRFPGGKGGNQALAAHRLGAEVYMVGCTGDDPAAVEAVAALKAEGVNLEYCQALAGEATGLALILVSDDGENQIVVAPGANAAFPTASLRIPPVQGMIAQLEVPLQTIELAATRHQGFFCLNAAPARPVPASLLRSVDLLIVNELESECVADALEGFSGLLATTYGSRGAVLTSGGSEIARARPEPVEAIDTTGAGDAFTAALTVALTAGMDAQAALELACKAGAITATRPGAQSAPTARELGL